MLNDEQEFHKIILIISVLRKKYKKNQRLNHHRVVRSLYSHGNQNHQLQESQ